MASKIMVPERLESLMRGSKYDGIVLEGCRKYSELFSDPAIGLYFFPEFTDHGPEHITNVLRSAESLVTEKSWKLIGGDDAAVLILAAIFHDSAMHLTADGFLSLLNAPKSANNPLVPQFDKLSWGELFEEFLSQARRWDSRRVFDVL